MPINMKPHERILKNRDGKAVVLPNPVLWNYTPNMITAIANQQNTTVLITGPTGCGKEELASILAADPKREFLAVNCSGMDGELLNSELFGHVKGAFTGANERRDGIIAKAAGKILFLDEIGRLSTGGQARLLRFMMTGEIRPVGSDEVKIIKDVRLIAATNIDVNDPKKFLPDLLYRFDYLIALPALHDRSEDIPALITLPGFLGTSSGYAGITLATLIDLMIYDWSGNIRELQRYCKNAVFYKRFDNECYTEEELWPKHVLHRSAKSAGMAPLKQDSRTADFSEFCIYVRNKILASKAAKKQLQSNKPLLNTVALLYSISLLRFSNEPETAHWNYDEKSTNPYLPPHPLLWPLSELSNNPGENKLVGYDMHHATYEVTGIDWVQEKESFFSRPIIDVSIVEAVYILTLLWRNFKGLYKPKAKTYVSDIFPEKDLIAGLLKNIQYPLVSVPDSENNQFIELLENLSVEKEDFDFVVNYSELKLRQLKQKEIAYEMGMALGTLKDRVTKLKDRFPDLAPYLAHTRGRPQKQHSE